MCNSGAGRNFGLLGRVRLGVTVATPTPSTTTSAVKQVGRALAFRLAHPSAAASAVPWSTVTWAIDAAVTRAVQAAMPGARTLSITLCAERGELREAHPRGVRAISFRLDSNGTMAASAAATFTAFGAAITRAIDTAIARTVKAAVPWTLGPVEAFFRNANASYRQR